MATYACRSRDELRKEYNIMVTRYEELKGQGLNLDMSRGKPSKLQLDAVSDILTVLTDPNDCILDGHDARNYGDLAGLWCAREYWADVLGCKPEQTFVGGNAALALMHDLISWAYTHGLRSPSVPGPRSGGSSSSAPPPATTATSASPRASASS